MASRWNTVKTAIVTTIQGRIGTSSGHPAGEVPSSQFYTAKVPWIKQIAGVTFPCVLIVPVTERRNTVTNDSIDIAHVVQVSICQASNRSVTSNQDRIQEWAEDAADDFQDQRLTSATDYHCTVEPREIFDIRSFLGNLDVVSFVVVATIRVVKPTPAA